MRPAALTLERLKEALIYEADEGFFVWRTRPSKRSRRRAGDRAGTVKTIRGVKYCYIGIDGHDYLASQLAWFYSRGEWPKGRVASANGDPLDIRLTNLVEMPGAPGDFDFDQRADRIAYLRAHRRANPDHYREKDLRRTFGISLDDYKRMLATQNGVCAICGNGETSTRNGKIKWLAVDHDSHTGRIRGLLCERCNTGIGKMRHSIDILEQAMQYLRKTS
jgi:Recombination endonuclease VII